MFKNMQLLFRAVNIDGVCIGQATELAQPLFGKQQVDTVANWQHPIAVIHG